MRVDELSRIRHSSLTPDLLFDKPAKKGTWRCTAIFMRRAPDRPADFALWACRDSHLTDHGKPPHLVRMSRTYNILLEVACAER